MIRPSIARSTLRPSIAAAAALALSALAPACGPSAAESAPKPTRDVAKGGSAAPSHPAVRFAKAEARKLPRTLELSGTLDADERSEVAAPAPGVALRIAVDAGTRVKKGDVLVELDGREAALRLASANANAAQQLARLGLEPGEPFDASHVPEVRAAKEARDLAVSEAERAKVLFQSGGLTQASLDQALSAAERAKAQLDTAKNAAEQAWAGLVAARAQASLSHKAVQDMRVRAPFDGAVVEKRIAPGEFAQMGRVVAVVVRDSPLRLRVDVPEADVGAVAVGRAVDVTVAAHPGRTFRGTIARVGASLRAQSRTLPVEAEVPNDDQLLRPGFFARAGIELGGAAEDAVVVPETALSRSGATARVFVRAGSRVVERLVIAGRTSGGWVEVRGTVAAGDEVAVAEVSSLTDGMEVGAAP